MKTIEFWQGFCYGALAATFGVWIAILLIDIATEENTCPAHPKPAAPTAGRTVV